MRGASLRPWLVVGAGTLLALLALAPSVVERDAVSSIDTAIKHIQSTELARTGFRSMAMPYPGKAMDPEERFLPFLPPFVFLSGGEWQSIFSSLYVALGALLLPFGIEALIGLAMVATAVTTASTSALPGARWAAAALLLAGTPVWLYGLTPNETPVALGCVTASLAVGARVVGRRGDWAAGLLLGIATLLRDESLLAGPGLLYARHLAGTPLRQMPYVIAGVGVPLVAMAAVDQWWFHRPMLAHLRHAVPGLDLVLPRSRARLPHLAAMPWNERYTTVVEYWLLGFGGLVAAAFAAAVVASHAVRRPRPWIVVGIVSAAAALHVIDLVALLPAPRIMAGLLRLSPFLLLAILPRAGGAPATPLVRLAWVTAAAYLAVVALTVNTEGGKPTGPRLIIALWPLLAAAAFDTLAGYVAAARREWPARLTAAAGIALAAGAVVMQLGVVLPARAGRADLDSASTALIRAIGDEVVVIDSQFEIQLLPSLYVDTKVFLAQPHESRAFSALAAAAGVDRFTLVVRPPSRPSTFPEYRQVDVRESGRFLISRWAREASGAP